MTKKSSRYQINSLRAALQGMAYALKREVNFRIEVAVGIVAVVLGVALSISQIEWLILVLTIGVVLALELVNTGFERLADAQIAHFDPQIKIAKDVSAGAVLIASIMSVAIGFWLFVPRIVDILVY
ncbi:MAG: diacylglycerol kinase family protein [bacterium]|nr:diacylglycerol kinase family protein [bacterium]